jgi:hypothetical protein
MRRRSIVLLLLLALMAAACGDSSDDGAEAATTTQAPIPPAGPGELIFSSGFSEGTEVAADLSDLHGVDAETGFSWDDTPAWIDRSEFYYAVRDPDQVSEFMDTDIIEAPGPAGDPSRVLHLVSKGNDPDQSATSRNEFSLFGKDEPDDFQEGFVRYWTKLQPDLASVVPADEDSRLYYLMEIKDHTLGEEGTGEGFSSFRMNIGLAQDAESRDLYWVATGEQVQPVRQIEWQARNASVDVPLGEWFLVEAYYKRHPTDGRVFLAVDGEVVFDVTARTQHRDDPQPLNFWSVFKLYHDPSWWAAGPTEQWYDDLEIWTSFPPDYAVPESVQP